jgi:hypothetical protein
MKIIGILLSFAAAIGAASTASTSSSKAASRGMDASIAADSSVASAAVTQVAMRNVNFYVTPVAALRIRTLRGEMRSLRGAPVVFDDKNAFVIRVASAEVGLLAYSVWMERD